MPNNKITAKEAIKIMDNEAMRGPQMSWLLVNKTKDDKLMLLIRPEVSPTTGLLWIMVEEPLPL